jgi:hypothetical protein
MSEIQEYNFHCGYKVQHISTSPNADAATGGKATLMATITVL